MAITENIIDIARDYVLQLLLSKLPNDMSFHHAMYTKDVVKAAIEISTESCLSSTQTDYPKYEYRLRMELKTYLAKTYTNEEWNDKNYALLKQHSYYTVYGKTVLKNLRK